jgi:hypothetical protein
MSTTSRVRGALGLLALAATLVALPAAAASAADPPVDLKLSMSRPDVRFGALELRARCTPGCTLRLRELNAVRYRTRGGVEQLPYSAIAPLSGTRRVPAGRTVVIRVPVPFAVREQAIAALPRGQAVVGHLVASVEQNGTTTDASRQFTATMAGTPQPFPATPFLDAIRVPRARKGRTSPAKRWRVTIAGRQITDWEYDRSEPAGTPCRMIAAGRGTQTLRFRSTKAVVVEEVAYGNGGLDLRVVGSGGIGSAPVPVRIDAVRDGVEQKGTEGGCGGDVGGDGGGGPGPACVRAGSAKAEFNVGYGASPRRDLFVFRGTGDDPLVPVAPDCPLELGAGLDDPFDALTPRPVSGGRLGGAGIVIARFRENRHAKLSGGGDELTRTEIVVTFKRV